LSEFDQFEAERFDLRKDAEHRGPIFKQAGEHGLAALQLRHHRGEGGQGGSWVDWASEVHAKRVA
jgi:hypothetical protein